MAKKKISNARAAANFGFLGAIIALGFTLFWPILDPVAVIVNTLIGYVIAFIINYLFRSYKYK
jgi:putative flippase GtrA